MLIQSDARNIPLKSGIVRCVVMVARDLGRVGIGCDLTYQELSKERIYGPLFAGTINS